MGVFSSDVRVLAVPLINLGDSERGNKPDVPAVM